MSSSSFKLDLFDITSLCLNVLVIVLYSERMIRKTPRKSSFCRWNKPRQYEFVAFLSVLINQICYFIIVLFESWPWLPAMGTTLGKFDLWKCIAVFCMHVTATCLAFGSLYRYERLLSVFRGTFRFRVLQALKLAMVVFSVLAFYTYVHWRILIPDFRNPMLPFMLYFHGVLEFATILYAGIIDLTSNVIMTHAVLYSLPRKINEPVRFATFKRKLWILLAVEIGFSFASAAFYFLKTNDSTNFAYIHISLIGICPVYVSFEPTKRYHSAYWKY